MESSIGFENEKNFIINNYNNLILHNSIILSGDKGIGKRTFVFDIIKNLISQNISKDKLDHHINLINNNAHSNIKYITSIYDSKLKKLKNYITVDQIRNLISFANETSIFKNLNKFIIIDSADELNINSANCLLKLLEEPNKDIFIFLITHNQSKLLPTIKSRCIKIKFLNHNFDSFKSILVNKFDLIEENHIKFLFDLSKGSPGKAIEFYDNDILNNYDNLIQCILNSKSMNENHFIISKKLSIYENEKFKNFLLIIKFILLNLLKIKFGLNLNKYYISNVFTDLINVSQNVSKKSLFNRLEYLINNENDLFTYNLDKNLFMLNFFLIK